MARRDFDERYGRGGRPGGYFGGTTRDENWNPEYRGEGYGREGYYGGGYDRDYYGGGYGGYGGYGRMGRETWRATYAGRGPKGYQRSDERILEEVNDRLMWHPEIDASDIEVRVDNGEVTLTGVVEDRHTKRMAEDAIEDTFGVNDVHNQLKIRHGFLAGLTGEKASDREVTRTAEREGTETARRKPRPGAGTRAGAATGRTTGKR